MSVIAVDIGSSRTKALLAGWDGRLTELRTAPTPRRAVEPGELAYPAETVYDTIEDLVAGLAGARAGDPIDTLVFSCLGTAMVPLDRGGRPLGPALAPADTRPMAAPPVPEQLGMRADELVTRTGSDPASPSFLAHVLWWQREHPRTMERLARFRSLRGYALARLCDADAEDRSWASRTMLFDLDASDWSPAILAAAGLAAEVLPPVEASTTVYPVRPAVAARLGLAPDAVIVLGGMDNGCALLGSVDPDGSGLANIVGTYEHIAGAAGLEQVRRVAAAAGAVVHAYPLPGRYVTMTRVPMGPLLERAAEGDPRGLAALLDGVAERPQGTRLALDFDAVDQARRDGLLGTAILQALLEASVRLLKRFADTWAALGLDAAQVAVIGGGATHPGVLQLKANMLGRPLFTLASDEGAATGALRLAAMAVRGLSAGDAGRLFGNPISRTFHPLSETAASP